MSEPDGELLAMVGLIGRELEANTEAIGAVRRWKQRVAWWAATAGAAAVLAFAATGVAVWQVSRNTQSVHASQISACSIANSTRAREVQLWEHVIQISRPPPGETPAQKADRQKRTTSFLGYIRTTFRPIDCARLYPG